MIRFTINSETKTISFDEGDVEEMKAVLEMFPNYTVTAFLDFPELNKSMT